jgi:hypothetical protein
MAEHPILDGTSRKLPEPLSEEDIEDLLTEALGLHAESTGAPTPRIRTFAESQLLLKNRGLVIGIGSQEFRVSIVRSR